MKIGGVNTIDFARVSKIPKFSVNVKSGDSKRVIPLVLLENNIAINLNEYTVTVAAVKSDGNNVFNDVTIIDPLAGVCEVEITEQMLATNLDLPCELVLYGKDGTVASSSNFVISRISSVRNEEIIVSSNEFTALTAALTRVQNFDNRINSKRDKSVKITKNDLDTSSNSAKIGLNNLSDEVHQAMSGNSPVNPTIPDGSLTMEKYADKSIVSNKMVNHTLHSIIYNEQKEIDFTFDNDNRQLIITLGAYTFLLAGTRYEYLNGDGSSKIVTLPYPENFAGVTSLWFIPSSKEFILANYKDYTSLGLTSSTEAYMIATVSISHQKINALCKFSINGNVFEDITLYGNGFFDFKFDFTKKTIRVTIPPFAYACKGSVYQSLGSTTVSKLIELPFPEVHDGVSFFIFNKSTASFDICNFRDINTIKNKNNILILGNISMSGDGYAYINGNYTINGGIQYGEVFIGFRTPIIVDKVNRKLLIPNFYVKSRHDLQGNRYITPAKCGLQTTYFEYDIPQGYEFNTIYLDLSKLKKFNDSANDNECPLVETTSGSLPSYGTGKNVLIATMLYGQVTTVYPYEVKEKNNGSVQNFATYNGHGFINFDWVNKEIQFPATGFIQYGSTYYNIDWDSDSGYKLPIEDATDGIQWLLFNLDTRKFKTVRYTGSSQPNWSERWVQVATFWIHHDVQIIGAYKINGKLFGQETKTSQIDTNFSIEDNKLILPSKMFFVKNEEIPIYLSSIIPNDAKTLAIKPSLIYKDGQTRKIEPFYDSTYLNSDKLSNTFRIGFRQYQDNKLYYKDISKVYCDPSTISNKTPKILHIGDSITNRNIAFRNEQFLNEWDITPTYVGTITNQSNRKGEGREGWSYPNFTGKGNIWGNNGSVIVPKQDGSITTLNQNPFIKIATEEDKVNHPEWCFRNTGSKRELSYADDSDKTGTFYIFDIEHYLSSHGVETPDIITIALSTNDINRDEDALEMCKFNMQLMVSRIRQQLPNTKIGIVPSPSWGFGNSNFKSKVVQWIEECISIIENMNDDKVFIIPVWCHMNKEWGFPIGNISDLSDTNKSKIGSITDTIHLSVFGEEQYGKVMAMFIANMIL